MSWWAELRRRNVFRVGTVYLAAAWVISQVGDVVAQAFDAPSWPMRMVLVILAIGLPVALVLSWLFELTPDGLKLTKDVAADASIAHHTGRRLDRVLIAMIGLLIVVLIADNWLLPAREAPLAPGQAAPTPTAATPAAAPAATPATTPAAPTARVRLANSVAVLPLENLSPDPNNAFFAAGIHEEILNYLAKLKSLNVIARTSMARYVGTDKTIQEIGAELNVATVMEGSVRYADNRVRITTQLIDAESGAHLWSDAYERDFEDIFAIQADIAMSVANALNAAFSPEEQREIERVPTMSPETYTLWLQYLDLAGRGNQSPQILALADQMIARDPNFAAPYVVKAATYSNLLINTTLGSAGDRAEMEALARTSAERAIALDPTGANGAYGALGSVDLFNWRWTAASATFERAYAASGRPPGYFPWFLSWSGQRARAIEVQQPVVGLDPNNWTPHWMLGIVSLYAGETDAAVTAFHRGIELAPALSLQHSWLAWAEIARGSDAAAQRELELAETMLGNNRALISLVDILYSYSRLGRRDEVARLHAEIEALARQQDIGTGGWAAVYLGIGDQEKALEQLRLGAQRARDHVLDQGFFTLMNIRMNVTRDPVLEQPEFVAVREQLKGD